MCVVRCAQRHLPPKRPLQVEIPSDFPVVKMFYDSNLFKYCVYRELYLEFQSEHTNDLTQHRRSQSGE
jgi:hypothetical protein